MIDTAEATSEVLVVDDEPAVGRAIAEGLTAIHCRCEICSDPNQARELLETERFNLLVTDIAMPGVTGLDLLLHAKRHCPDCKVVLLTGLTNRETLSQALILGAFDYLEKPFRPDDLADCVQSAIQASHAAPPLPMKAAAAMEIGSKAVQASLDSVRALVRAVEAKDPHTRRHSEHVAKYAVGIAQCVGLPGPQIESVRIASLLHDVGKIGVPDRILTKPGPLTNAEYELVRRHPALGADILADITLFGHEADIVRHHHENWDGSGYPDGLGGEDIPMGSRLIMLADAIDAMFMARSYKPGYPMDKVLRELHRCAGTQFDPNLASVAAEWCRYSYGELSLPPGELGSTLARA